MASYRTLINAPITMVNAAKKIIMLPAANPTIASYSATNSLVRLKKKS
jgi:hypothetical protein